MLCQRPGLEEGGLLLRLDRHSCRRVVAMLPKAAQSKMFSPIKCLEIIDYVSSLKYGRQKHCRAVQNYLLFIRRLIFIYLNAFGPKASDHLQLFLAKDGKE